VSENLIPISDDQAKLGQEILKTLRGFGSFLEKALGSTPEDLIAYLGGDWLRVRRAENLMMLFEKAKQRLADRNVKTPIPASLSVALPILQGAADEDREALTDLWARLLANAMDPSMNSVRYAFIDAVKRMDPVDAVVLRYIYQTKISEVALGRTDTESGTVGFTNIASAINRQPEEVELSLRHLQELLFFDQAPLAGYNRGWSVNVKGREFLRACYPEVKIE
jgi:hypothetical protein